MEDKGKQNERRKLKTLKKKRKTHMYAKVYEQFREFHITQNSKTETQNTNKCFEYSFTPKIGNATKT